MERVLVCHVLVIEDDWFIACHIVEIVERAGATSTSTAATENEAIAAARARLPGMILSDVELAQGTGPKAVKAILAEHGEIPVIFITGTPEACAPCEPPHQILTKPVAERVLAESFKMRAPL